MGNIRHSYRTYIPGLDEMILLATIAILLLQPASGSQRCLECTDLPRPEDCTKVTLCGSSEKCYVEEFVTTGGLLLYKSGCLSNTRCNIHKRRSYRDAVFKRQQDPDIDLCTQCCDGDYCNREGCGLTVPDRSRRGPVCFSCDYQSDPESCRDVTQCDPDEACLLTEYVSGNRLIYRSSCERKLACQIIGSHLHLTGKRDTRSAYDVCPKCCHDDFCNHSCRQNVTLPSVVTTGRPTAATTYKPVVTTQKPTTTTAHKLLVTTNKPTATTTHKSVVTTQQPTAKPTHKNVVTTSKPTTKPTHKTVVTTQQPTAKPTHKNVVTTSKPTTKPTHKTVVTTNKPTAKPTHKNVVTTSKPTTKPTHKTLLTTNKPTAKPTHKNVVTTNKPTTKTTHKTVVTTHKTTVKTTRSKVITTPATTRTPTTTALPTTPTTSDPAVACRADHYTYYDRFDLCLKFHMTPKNWTDAESVCTTEGGTLAVIDTTSTLDRFKSAMRLNPSYSSGNFWVGASDKDGQIQFHWLNGHIASFNSSQTTDMRNAHCVLIDISSPQIFLSKLCPELHRFICERKKSIH